MDCVGRCDIGVFVVLAMVRMVGVVPGMLGCGIVVGDSGGFPVVRIVGGSYCSG